jgi:(p)ppGpp synthase/HD superfamily hydrolase
MQMQGVFINQNMYKPSLIEKAIRIAAVAHNGQKRKDSDLPYIVHPIAVALKLEKYNFPDEVIAAALVHDVLEDTDFLEERLKEELGNEVFEIVKALANDDSLFWEKKKKRYIETVKNGSEGAKAVATADKIHNAESLLLAYQEQGPLVWKHFNRGKEKKIWFEKEALKMLKETWQHPLVDEYEILVSRMEEMEG